MIFDRLPAADLVADGPEAGRGVVQIQDSPRGAQERAIDAAILLGASAALIRSTTQ